MLPFNKALSEITERDLAALVAAHALETRQLEFKLTLPGAAREDKKEFLADVSSFANSGGGVILYGVCAKDGAAESLPGVSQINPDDERLRLEQMVRTGLDPRIPGLALYLVELPTGAWVFMVSVPRSFSAPHRVRESSKFYSRHSGGKFELDTAEIRSAVLGTESVVERIRDFRDDRLAKIAAGTTPFLLDQKAKIAFHILPLAAFTVGFQCDLKLLNANPDCAQLFGSQQGYTRFRHTFEGVLVGNRNEDPTNSYTEFYRTGCIECVDTRFLESTPEGAKVAVPAVLASELIVTLHNYLNTLERLAVEPPFYVVVSLLNILGFVLERDYGYYPPDITNHCTNREHLICPEVLVDDPKTNLGMLLKPTLDLIWNAFGWPSCAYYDADGNLAAGRQRNVWGI